MTLPPPPRDPMPNPGDNLGEWLGLLHQTLNYRLARMEQLLTLILLGIGGLLAAVGLPPIIGGSP